MFSISVFNIRKPMIGLGHSSGYQVETSDTRLKLCGTFEIINSVFSAHAKNIDINFGEI